MIFLMWYSDKPKETLAEKVAAARLAFAERWGGALPTLVLVNPADAAGQDVPGVTPAPNVQRNTVWVGMGEVSK